MQKYAELLNLLDKKEMFNYKTGSSNEELFISYQKFKESFYELVHKFPHISYLSVSNQSEFKWDRFILAELFKDPCVTNCIEHYLQRKCLPGYNANAIADIGQLLDKYFRQNIEDCLYFDRDFYFVNFKGWEIIKWENLCLKRCSKS